MFTPAQRKSLAIVPKFTASFSAIASFCICFIIIRRKSPTNKTYNRIIFGMSVCDMLTSVGFFCTTWPVPKGTPGIYGALGNQGTCSAQGFISQFSLSTVMYNASLSLYYMFVIVKKMKDDKIVRIEPLFHTVAIGLGLSTAIAGVALKLFNPVGWNCWLSSAPLGCTQSYASPDGTTNCIRGDNSSLYRWGFYYAPLWFAIACETYLMYRVYAYVKVQEQKIERYTRDSSVARMVRTKRTSRQALAYLGASYATWFFPTIFQIVVVVHRPLFPLLLITAMFIPIQGILNLIVFIRPTYIRYRKDHPEGSVISAWFRMIGVELGLLKVDKKCTGASEEHRSSTLTNHFSTRKLTTQPSFQSFFKGKNLSDDTDDVEQSIETIKEKDDDGKMTLESLNDNFEEDA